MDWSPDGRLLLVVEGAPNRTFGGDLWLLRTDGGKGERKLIPFLTTPAREYDAQFSPDGRWIAYVSEESGPRHVYVAGYSRDAPEKGPTSKWQISTTNGTLPRWRADGRELFYLGADNRMMAASVSVRGDVLTVDSVRPLFTVNAPLGGGSYDVAPDGQRFLVNAFSEQEQAPLSLVVNWTTLVRK